MIPETTTPGSDGLASEAPIVSSLSKRVSSYTGMETSAVEPPIGIVTSVPLKLAWSLPKLALPAVLLSVKVIAEAVLFTFASDTL